MRVMGCVVRVLFRIAEGGGVAEDSGGAQGFSGEDNKVENQTSSVNY